LFKRQILDFAAWQAGGEENQLDGLAQLGISVVRAVDFPADSRFCAELFFEFALERLRERFAGLRFSARKLPHEAERVIPSALADKQLAAGFDQSCHDRNH
jgi:hypothetical protein